MVVLHFRAISNSYRAVFPGLTCAGELSVGVCGAAGGKAGHHLVALDELDSLLPLSYPFLMAVT